MRTRSRVRRGKRGERSSQERSEVRLEERLDNQDANSIPMSVCDCGEANLLAETICDTCGTSSEDEPTGSN